MHFDIATCMGCIYAVMCYNVYWGDKMKNYAALIMDLKKSRSYSVEYRNSIQNYILSVIRHLNEVFSHVVIRGVEFSAGDEMQGLFSSPEAAYLYFRMFRMIVFPVETRAGIGVGEWNVKIEHASTTVQDGPVYHNARYAIEHAKDAQGYPVLLYSEKKNDVFLNTAINTPFILTGKHSEYQNELMLMSELLYPIDFQKAVDCSKIDMVFQLAASKNKLNYYTYYKKTKTVKKYPFDMAELVNLKSLPTEATNNHNDFYIVAGKKRGMATQLSEILNISRQSIEKTFKAANIYEARNSTIAALQLMDKYL